MVGDFYPEHPYPETNLKTYADIWLGNNLKIINNELSDKYGITSSTNKRGLHGGSKDYVTMDGKHNFASLFEIITYNIFSFTKKNIFVYALILFPITLLPFYFKFASFVYLIPTIILGLFYIFLTYRLLTSDNKKNTGILSKKIFGFSILYLFLIFALLLIESFINFSK